jgi:galactose oxidase
MNFPRRQHNATVLPDGTVLVTGGTQGMANASQADNFNNLGPHAPVHQAKLWAPGNGGGEWALMTTESVDRCYRSTALLLPDGRVLSAGGGEFADPDHPNRPNSPAACHPEAQLFSPPYLLTGISRPTI